MALVTEKLTKTGKKMYVTERDGKTYASFTMKAIEALLAGQEVSARQPQEGGWIFVDLMKGGSVAQPVVQVPAATIALAVSAPLPATAPATVSFTPSPPTSGIGVVMDGQGAVLKAKLSQIMGELQELIGLLG